MGSVVGVLLFLPLITAPWYVKGGAILVAAALGCFICEYAAKRLKQADLGCIVWDEIVRVWIALFFVPWSLAWIAFAFLCFRLFDIAKPPPVGWADRHVKGGVGIMVDDLIAGAMASVLIYLALRLV